MNHRLNTEPGTGHAARERGIPFGQPMVRALQREVDPKTQTRREVNPQPDARCTDAFLGADGIWRFSYPTAMRPVSHAEWDVRCPYGVPGDRLWVREAFRTYDAYDDESMGHMQERLACTGRPDLMAGIAPIQYEADGERRNWLADNAVPGRYRHARFMPRWASRILLEITDIRVQRLQAISHVDTRAEGITYDLKRLGWHTEEGRHFHCIDPRESYFSLWEALNGSGSVEANRWVWAITFKRLKP